MPAAPETESHYFNNLLDNAKASALQRGAETPGWSDVWTAMTMTPEFAGVMQKRGIDTRTLALEVAFLDRFVPPEKAPQPATYTQEEIRQSLQELVDSAQNIQKLMEVAQNVASDAEGKALKQELSATGAISQALDLLGQDFVEQLRQRENDPEAIKRRAGLKKMIISHAAHQPYEGRLLNADPDTAALFEQLQDSAIRFMQEQLVKQPFDMQPEDKGALQMLEPMKRNALMGMSSPSDVFEFVVARSGPVYEDLLYRNGMRSNDPERADILENLLPEREVQAVMLAGLREAYQENARQLEKRHFASALLEHTAVQRHLSVLGVKDLQKFTEKVQNLLSPEEKAEKGKKQSKIASHPRLGDDVQSVIKALDASWKKDERMEELFYLLVKSDKQVGKAMTRAGVTRDMMSDWRKKYDAKEKTKKPGKDKPGRDWDDEEEVPALDRSAFEKIVQKYSTDYTALAKKKKFDPMVGNAHVVDQMTTAILKRGKKNPLIVGEPGIGKTKAFEGFSQAIVEGKVPKKFIGARFIMLDLQAMNDSPYVSMFETKFKGFMNFVAANNADPKNAPILVGIDELGENMDAGGHTHSSGFRGLVKPYLTSGDLITVSTATEDEYHKKIEKDPALARRFQTVFMKEPTDAEAARILKGLAGKYEKHYRGLKIPAPVLDYIAKMAGEYIHNVRHPDKDIDLLDEALALTYKLSDADAKMPTAAEIEAKNSVAAKSARLAKHKYGKDMHPYAEIFPSPAMDVFEKKLQERKTMDAGKDSGKAKPGQKKKQKALTVYTLGGKVLEGRERLLSAAALKRKVEFVEYQGDDPLGFVVMNNLRKTHLTSAQKAVVGAKLIAATAEGSPEKAFTPERAATRLHVTAEALTQARAILDSGNKEVVQSVTEGKATLHAAQRKLAQLAKAAAGNKPAEAKRKPVGRVLTKDIVNMVLADKTNIERSFFSESDNKHIASLPKELDSIVYDQHKAVTTIAKAVQRAKAGLKSGKGPIGVFLLLGPTGVGKTETAKGLARTVMGSEEQFLIRYDMSEYMESNQANRLIGSPPGYVGHDEGGQLINQLRSKPNAVYLFDEAEKAHPDIYKALLAPFDNGIITDGTGKKGTMEHAIVILTSNLGATEVETELRRRNEEADRLDKKGKHKEAAILRIDPDKDPEKYQAMAEPIYDAAVRRVFSPEFRNRLTAIIKFKPLSSKTMNKLVVKAEKATRENIREKYGLDFEVSSVFREKAKKNGFDPLMGARPLARAWVDAVETPLSDWLLRQNARKLKKAKAIVMEAANDGTPKITLVMREEAKNMTSPKKAKTPAQAAAPAQTQQQAL